MNSREKMDQKQLEMDRRQLEIDRRELEIDRRESQLTKEAAAKKEEEKQFLIEYEEKKTLLLDEMQRKKLDAVVAENYELAISIRDEIDFIEKDGMTTEHMEATLDAKFNPKPMKKTTKTTKTKTTKSAGGTRTRRVIRDGFISSFRVDSAGRTNGKNSKFVMKDGKICEYNQTWITNNNPAMNQWIEEKEILAKYFERPKEAGGARPYTNSNQVMPGWLMNGRDYVIYEEGERPICDWD